MTMSAGKVGDVEQATGGDDLALPPARVEAYLRRLGVTDPVEPTAAHLTRLMAAHLATVPFENLDIHIGTPIRLDIDRIVEKLVDRSRGGFCYELNGGFAALLRGVGFSVDLLEARVFSPTGLGIHFDHLCLAARATDSAAPWLVDVGFGSAFAEPLQLELTGVQQHDPAGVFLLTDAPDGWRDLTQDGAPQYRFSLQPRRYADFSEGCAYHQSPESHFTQSTICSLPRDGGRVSLAGTTLIHTSRAGARRETTVALADVGATLQAEFGIALTDGELAGLHRVIAPAA